MMSGEDCGHVMVPDSSQGEICSSPDRISVSPGRYSASPARMSRSEMELKLDMIEEDCQQQQQQEQQELQQDQDEETRSAVATAGASSRRFSDPEIGYLEALNYRLSLYLNDPETGGCPGSGRRRTSRSRRRLSRRSSEYIARPQSASQTGLCRRHSELLPPAAGHRRTSRRSSRRSSVRGADSRAGSVRRLQSVTSLTSRGDTVISELLPSRDLEPKERRRRQVVLAVMAGTFIILSMAIGLVFVMLHLTSSQNVYDSHDVRKENEEIYRDMKTALTTTIPTPSEPPDGNG